VPQIAGSRTAGGAIGEREIVGNPGFETGSLPPWEGPAWRVDSVFPRSGRYRASDVGNYPLKQLFDTVPGTEIQSVSFWARQPDQPAAQAYTFFYDDGTSEQFVHFPTPSWAMFDVTGRLNRSKKLVGFELWGYSGGGPGPDSTCVDDVSILVQDPVRDAGVAAILWPRDTVRFDTVHIPRARIVNSGTQTELVPVVMMLEDICDPTPYYWDTVNQMLAPGETAEVEFAPWQPRYPALHRANCWTILAGDTSHANDTIRQFFWARPGVGCAESGPDLVPVSAAMILEALPGVIRAGRFEWAGGAPLPVLDVSGRRVSPPVRPGVYFLRPARPGTAEGPGRGTAGARKIVVR
jgi:hypothetical protein